MARRSVGTGLANARIRPIAPVRGGGTRHRAIGRDRRRFWHHGRNPDQRRRARAARQHAAHGRDPGGSHHHSRAHIGRAFQSGRVAGLCAEARTDAAGSVALRRRAGRRRHCRNHDRACDVCVAADRRVAENANRRFAMVCRRRRGIRPARDHPRRHKVQPRGSPVAGRSLHHRRLLVHGLDLVCQSRRCHRTIDDQYVFGDSARGPSRLYRGRTLRRCRGADLHELAAARGGGAAKTREAQT